MQTCVRMYIEIELLHE